MDELRIDERFLHAEIERIVAFIRQQTTTVRNVVIGVSGGVDSDVATRLCVRAIGPERVKCVMILQQGLDAHYVENAHALAHDVGVRLAEVDFGATSQELFKRIRDGDPDFGFKTHANSLDIGRGKCALRSFVFSAYCEHGFLVVGPSVRTEYELGYFLPLGDGAAHISPLVHLYKSEIFALAGMVGTAKRVREQAPAAGFSSGDEDLRGIAVWLFYEKPMEAEEQIDKEAEIKIQAIRSELTFRRIDEALIGFANGLSIEVIATRSNLSLETVIRLGRLRDRACERKRFPLRCHLSRED